MKKQILLLIVAIMASLTVAWAQTTPPNLSAAIASCPTATPITATCVANSGPFSPIAGTEYTYTANIPTPVGGKTYHWFVTTELNFISSGVLTTDIEVAGASSSYVAHGNANYNVPTLTATAPTDVSVAITWKAFTHDPAKPVLLVIYVQDDACDNNNIEAYLIRPVHAFTLDIANLRSNGTLPGATNLICVSPVESAQYVITNTATGEGRIEFDYGTNYMFFIVTAANFTHSWLPRFQVSGDAFTGSREVTEVAWAYPEEAHGATAVWTVMNGSGGNNTIFTSDDDNPVLAKATSGSVDADGECIVVRITIANNQDETTDDEDVILAVDGIMYNAALDNYTTATLADIHHTNGPGVDDCPWYDEFLHDFATQTLTARPNINDATPPATDDFVPTDRNN